MTRPGWAEKAARKAAHSIQPVDFGSCEGIRVFAKTLEAEHRRAVRVVRRELEKFQRRRECETNASQRDMLGGAMLAYSNILAALQKGRT